MTQIYFSEARHADDVLRLTLGAAQLICAPTEAEARQRQQAILDHADKVAVENFMKFLGIKSQSFEETLRAHRELFVTSGGGFPMVGTPDQIVAQMGDMAEAGIDGFVLGFFDYYPELGFFGDHVMPLLRKAGLHV